MNSIMRHNFVASGTIIMIKLGTIMIMIKIVMMIKLIGLVNEIALRLKRSRRGGRGRC